MRESSEFLRAVARNWRSPKEREQLVEAMRRKDALLDRKIAINRGWKADTDEAIADKISADLEPVVHKMRRRGEISGGARKVLLSPSRS